MALLGAYSVLTKHPGRNITGNIIAQNPSNFGKNGNNRNRYLSYSPFSHTPEGYTPPYSYVMAQKSGGMATFSTISGSSTVSSATLVAGINVIASLAGDGTISSATGALVVSAVATILCSSSISNAELLGKLEAVATLAGTGDVTAAIGALAGMLATIPGTGTLSNALITAIGSMSGDILVNSEATITNESIAAEVWNTIIESDLTAEEILRVVLAVQAGKTNISGSTVTFRDVDDTVDRVTATMSGSERATMVLNP